MMPFRRYAPLAALASPLLIGLVSACASPGQFPSLARRPQEEVPGRISGTLAAPVVTLPVPGAPPPGVGAATPAVAELRVRASAAHDSFAAQSARDGRTIRAGRAAAVGRAAGAPASAALADLTGSRDATLAVLAELDGRYADQRIEGGDAGAVAAVRDQVAAWVADEDAALAELNRP